MKGTPNKAQLVPQKSFHGSTPVIVMVDTLSGLLTTSDGSKYILVLMDYFTQWACAFTLSDAEASMCMQVIYDHAIVMQERNLSQRYSMNRVNWWVLTNHIPRAFTSLTDRTHEQDSTPASDNPATWPNAYLLSE